MSIVYIEQLATAGKFQTIYIRFPETEVIGSFRRDRSTFMESSRSLSVSFTHPIYVGTLAHVCVINFVCVLENGPGVWHHTRHRKLDKNVTYNSPLIYETGIDSESLLERLCVS